MRAEDHEHDQHHRVGEHAIVGERAQRLRQNREHDSRQDRTGERTHAAEHDHDHVVRGLQPARVRRGERTHILCVNAAGKPCEERGNREHEHLEVRNVQTGCAGRDLVVTNRLDRTAVARTREHEQQHDSEHGDPEHHVEVGDTVDADKRLTGLALIKADTAGGGDVLQHDADNLAEAEGDNRQVIAMQTQRRNTDQNAENAGDHGAHENREQEASGRVHRDALGDNQLAEQGCGVGADHLKTAAAECQLAEHADRQVQGRGHDDRDAAGHQDALDIRVRGPGFAYRHQQAEQHGDTHSAHDIGLFHGKRGFLHRHTFSVSGSPIRPDGRTSSTMMRIANTIASENADVITPPVIVPI